jgi:hypothetical protein
LFFIPLGISLVPQLKGSLVLPVIFVCHSTGHIMSAHSFESEQASESFGAILARNTLLGGCVVTRSSMPNDTQCRNFQSNRFVMMYFDSECSELSRATAASVALTFLAL